MKKGIFIQANNKQLLGAKIAKFAMETKGLAKKNGIPVTIINVEDVPIYMKFVGMEYKRGEEKRIHDPKDLQFFTLSRFMPPELMNYEGLAVVIDPDIFALSDINELFSFHISGNSITACKKKDFWDTSVMLLDCSKLKHWNIESILSGLKSGKEDYRSWMQLKNESDVEKLPREWNSLDLLQDDTKMLHTTNRLTQPWRTGLPVDFTPGTVPKLFRIIPRFWVKQVTHYQKHPDREIEELFFELTNGALENGYISRSEMEDAILNNDLRSDIFERI